MNQTCGFRCPSCLGCCSKVLGHLEAGGLELCCLACDLVFVADPFLDSLLERGDTAA